jgi:ribosomal protein S25
MKLNVTFKQVTKEDEEEKGNKDKRKWYGEREKEGTKEIIRFRNNVM